MTCSTFVHIEYSKELEEKIREIPGIIPVEPFDGADSGRIRVPEELFLKHKKEVDAHRWVVGKDGTMGHFPENPGKWEYKGHGFEIWLGFEGDIVFVVPCHWDPDHGHLTLLDMAEWIKANLGDIKIKCENVS